MKTTLNPANQLLQCSVGRPVAAKASCWKCVFLQRPQKQQNSFPKAIGVGSLHSHAQRSRALCRASHEEASTEGKDVSKDAPADYDSTQRIKTTIADLDALLGIEPEEDKEKAARKEGANVSIAPGVMDVLAKAESDRQRNSGNETDELEKKLTEQMAKIVEQAKKMQGSNNNLDSKETEKLLGEFGTLIQNLRPEGGVDKEDMKKLKEEVFGQTVFWVTDVKNEVLGIPTIDGSVLVRGNLRMPIEKLFETVEANFKKVFGDKYTFLMVEDQEGDEESNLSGAPRVAFSVMPTKMAQPPQTTGWQVAVASILLVLTLGTAAQLGLQANEFRLPPDVVEFLSKPENLDAGTMAPGLENFDMLPIFLAALPISTSVLVVNFVHELGHRIIAFQKKIKLGPTFLVPNGQLGSFGAVTQFRSLIRNRLDLFDVSAAGPILGGVASLAFFLGGLIMTAGGEVAPETLVPVPSALFQGSLLLGSTAHALLGAAALSQKSVLIHPLVIGGWCGLVTTAFNCLPVGSLDGGRMFQAAFGRTPLVVSSFLTYAGLGLGLLGSSLALPFGLFVLVCNRTPESFVQDSVSPTDYVRQGIALGLAVAAVLILLPMALPGSGGDVGQGGYYL